MSILTEISLGEFLDKLTILRIKAERIKDPAKLHNINSELGRLEQQWRQAPQNGADVNDELEQLRSVNEVLWEIEDDIREKEARGEFDAQFIELARSVYLNNDRRARLKNIINRKLGSALVEEKSYTEYSGDKHC